MLREVVGKPPVPPDRTFLALFWLVRTRMRVMAYRRILSDNRRKEFPAERFLAFKEAREGLLVRLAIEEKFDLLQENYCEFESELLRLTTRYMMFYLENADAFRGDVQLINRRLSNLLSSCRLYIDQVKQDIGHIYGDFPECEVAKSYFSAEFDGKPAYRFMEKLRNYSQHNNLPVHCLNYKSSRVRTGPLPFVDVDPPDVKVMVQPAALVEQLREDQKFKNFDFAGLVDEDERVDLKSATRGYLASLDVIHRKVRDLVEPKVTKWEELASVVAGELYEFFGGDLTEVALASIDEHGETIETVSVEVQWIIDRWGRLSRKNGSVQLADHVYVSGELYDRSGR